MSSSVIDKYGFQLSTLQDRTLVEWQNILLNSKVFIALAFTKEDNN